MLGLGSSITRPPSRFLPDDKPASPQNSRGYVFDGAGDFLEAADHDEFSFENHLAGSTVDERFSFAVWVKRDDNELNECVMAKASGGAGSSPAEYRFYFTAASVYVDIHQGNSTTFSRHVAGNISTTAWQHWVITYNGAPDSGIIIYLNGSNVGTLQKSAGNGGGNMTNTTATFKLGRMDDNDFDFDGKMMQAVLWKNTLSSDEVAYLYAGGNAARDPNFDTTSYTNSNAVVAWYPMVDANGHKDASGTDFASGIAFDTTKNGNVNLDTSDDAPW